MARRVDAVLDTARQWVTAPVADNPSLWVFYVVLGAWTILGLFTLFVGILGLLLQGLLLLLLLPAALLASSGVGRARTRAARIQTGAAFVIAVRAVGALTRTTSAKAASLRCGGV